MQCACNHWRSKRLHSQNKPCVVIQMQRHGCILMRYVVTHKLRHDSVISSRCSEWLLQRGGYATQCLDQVETHVGNRQVITVVEAWSATSAAFRTTQGRLGHVGLLSVEKVTLQFQLQFNIMPQSGQPETRFLQQSLWVTGFAVRQLSRQTIVLNRTFTLKENSTPSTQISHLPILTWFGLRQKHERCTTLEPI